ncbi:MAG: proline dehydrogenase family protein [Chlorobi bacterium]|nr:proline dehydrogenase family protein [Chlorobiota bacterium]
MGFFNRLIAKTLPYTPKPLVKVVAMRYIAGVTVEEAMKTIEELNRGGSLATVDLLGEFVKSREVAAKETRQILSILDKIAQRQVKSGLSVKLTFLGLDVSPEFCRENLRRILEKACQLGIFVRIDMENSPYTDETFQIGLEMWNEFQGTVGLVLQAYLRRTLSDIEALAPSGISFRLCKGIYVEPEEIAYTDREEVRQNYLRCLAAILDRGSFVGIATHDDVLIDGARRMIAERGLDRDDYEFQMLLGVREQKRRELIDEGHRMRVYVPFGQDWYGYSIRRLKENPAIAGYVFKALFTGD